MTLRTTKKKAARNFPDATQMLLERMRQKHPNLKVIQSPTSPDEKMSVKLDKFMEPYFDANDSAEFMNVLYSVGVAAWNLAVLGPLKRSREPTPSLTRKPGRLAHPGQKPSSRN